MIRQPHDGTPQPCDLLVCAHAALLMDPAFTIASDVAVASGRIVAVGPAAELDRVFAPTRRLGSRRHLLMPGLVVEGGDCRTAARNPG